MIDYSKIESLTKEEKLYIVKQHNAEYSRNLRSKKKAELDELRKIKEEYEKMSKSK